MRCAMDFSTIIINDEASFANDWETLVNLSKRKEVTYDLVKAEANCW